MADKISGEMSACRFMQCNTLIQLIFKKKPISGLTGITKFSSCDEIGRTINRRNQYDCLYDIYWYPSHGKSILTSG